MEKRFTFTDMELALAKQNHGWMGKYLKQLQNATVSKIYLAIADDDPKLAFPVIDFKLENGETYLCEIVCSAETDMPGFIIGLPFKSEDK
jgi:hypothetical protein